MSFDEKKPIYWELTLISSYVSIYTYVNVIFLRIVGGTSAIFDLNLCTYSLNPLKHDAFWENAKDSQNLDYMTRLNI